MSWRERDCGLAAKGNGLCVAPPCRRQVLFEGGLIVLCGEVNNNSSGNNGKNAGLQQQQHYWGRLQGCGFWGCYDLLCQLESFGP